MQETLVDQVDEPPLDVDHPLLEDPQVEALVLDHQVVDRQDPLAPDHQEDLLVEVLAPDHQEDPLVVEEDKWLQINNKSV